ncbi:binding-protein-dependent transport systems inner membrane component [Sulfolobus islandicus Y.N.15.51]|jgi:NitT/TauT family transport system permease protein|uniref:Binding-protein-dependent transport systems inner membrane component n=1 Tax=Saccharolobus islandicus (strain Y.N.15.51 / Yellowstone \|nr:ABC transporter permease subunit [Sulfolobus islandicus]ACP49765.1 binding-protein-dependent transport systems inner membrane component [Sulfolobus islandicus Y.N.15.51]
MNEILLIFLASLASLGRVFLTIGLSIITGWFLGYIAIKSKAFENIYISVVEIFESVPVISFFPVVLIFFVYRIGGYIGIELAVDFLVFTAVVWNIWIGIYQAFKTVPSDLLEVSENYRLGFLGKMAKLYIPYSWPRIAANLIPSFADAIFYITVSEVFSIGSSSYHVFGIGTLIGEFTASQEYTLALDGLGILAIPIIIFTYLLRRFANYTVSKYGLDTEIKVTKRGRMRIRYATRMSNTIAPFVKLSKYVTRIGSRSASSEEETRRNLPWRYLGIGISVLLLGLLVYGAFSTISSVPKSVWLYLISTTPNVLFNLLIDYIRVLFIAIVSLVFSIFLGYFIATRERVEKVLIPAIQTYASFPAPAYFPLLFTATISFIHTVFGSWTDEFYVILLGFISTFYYVFYSYWLGIKNVPNQYWEIMKNYNFSFWHKLRYVIIPSTFPYIISGLSSTINSAWGGLAIGEYWEISNSYTLQVSHGIMKSIAVATANGNIPLAAWDSLIFGIVVMIYSIFFTRKMMDLAREKYVAEEGIYLP